MGIKKKQLWRIIVFAVIVLGVGVCWGYVSDDYHADEMAMAAMNSEADRLVEQNGKTTAFVPPETDTGLIFYPGGKVEAIAYAPLMKQLADEGILCVLAEMPMNLAVLDRNAADGIPEQYPQIERWFLGGHSLGGSMAASYAAKNAAAYEGLILLAAYSTADLTGTDLSVISVYGSEDSVLNMEKYMEYSRNLPAGLEEHIIEGGCHAGFGSYGPQAGDGIPSITGEEQIAQTTSLLVDFMAAHQN